ncbi:ELMO domain-containing protein 2-like protein [Dinothrombium tinctorium]|uniref:ELMO domain-containing protein 2-like protein n=1 Tax=Dinothrombium tinctorium TaxID=1965070 RepID=A0A443RC52_9ACAR|nr:ELMO domain-containing protein 2-like protein [Dinothrombium tinctorium]
MFSEFISRILSLIAYYFRPLLKAFLRKTTGLCELQRVCYRNEKGAKRTTGVEHSITASRSKVITRIRQKFTDLSEHSGKFSVNNQQEVVKLIEFALEGICIDKKIKANIHREFLDALRICFLQIYGYKQLIYEVDSLKNTSYDANDANHEQKLLQLWHLLMPGIALQSRVSKQWTEIGFQGEDPKTDFRGMGLLGLENLLYFAKTYPSSARQILLHSNHPSHGYPFAITGINITFIAYILLKRGNLKTHFYNTYFSTVCLEDFHKVYCYLFLHFDRFWLKEKPKDVMEFRYIKEKFVNEISARLTDLSTVLKIDAVETI